MRIIVLAGALLVGGCAPRLEAVHGRAALELMRQPDRVEAFRLKRKAPASGGPISGVADYIVEVGGSVEVTPESVRELSAILTDDGSYLWGIHKRCFPAPGVKLRFVRGRAYADMYLCFACGILMSGGSMKTENWANFDPVAARLAAVVKRIFPADSSQFLH